MDSYVTVPVFPLRGDLWVQRGPGKSHFRLVQSVAANTLYFIDEHRRRKLSSVNGFQAWTKLADFHGNTTTSFP